MGLITDETHWIFMLPSSGEAEERHIYDIAFGIKVLLRKTVKYNCISIVIDNPAFTKLSAVFSKLSVSLPSKIFSTSQLPELLESNTFRNIVVFVTGHGSPDGLDTNPPIKPYTFYKYFQTAKKLKKAVFFFGQCYAGIFNQMPLSTHLGLPDTKCNMVAVGGTGLFPSISSPVTVDDVTWSGNLFLTNVFIWLLKNEDIDGDGKLSVTDSFKYASIFTNEALINIKKRDNILSIIEQAELIRCIDKLQSKETSDADKNNLQLEIQSLEKILEIRYVTQEPWLLNAHIAMNIEF